MNWMKTSNNIFHHSSYFAFYLRFSRKSDFRKSYNGLGSCSTYLIGFGFVDWQLTHEKRETD